MFAFFQAAGILFAYKQLFAILLWKWANKKAKNMAPQRTPSTKTEPTKVKRKYKKRIIVAKRLPVGTDGELCAAQQFNERIDEFLSKLEAAVYPMSRIEPNLLEQVVEITELLQESVVDGIEAFSVRRSPSCHAEAPEGQINEESFLPGAFGMGRKNGRGGYRRVCGEG